MDYSKSQHILDALLRAVRERRICTVKYRSPEWPKARTLTVAPYKFISFREGVYAKCREEDALRSKDQVITPKKVEISHFVRNDKILRTYSSKGRLSGLAVLVACGLPSFVDA
ncbi:MAG: hypothetical protein QG656_1601 [Candidatus Hydrogenedentes bacterium]|nr:hypothetical protein [Candidatus Hydrogenedentota bacterium]